jgi:hypothetical protein
MKTICSLLVTLFAVVLIASAAPQNNLASTLSISCPTGDCAGTIQFDFANLDPTATYAFAGVNTTTGDTCGGTVKANPDGTLSFTESFLSAGTWEFTLTELHKNGRPVHNGVIFDQLFDVP